MYQEDFATLGHNKMVQHVLIDHFMLQLVLKFWVQTTFMSVCLQLSSRPLETSFLKLLLQIFARALLCLMPVLSVSFRTKWKRQNQLRLEQLRQQSSVEKELLSSGALRAAEGNPCCSSRTIARYGAQSPCSFLTSAAAAIFHNVTYVHGCQL